MTPDRQQQLSDQLQDMILGTFQQPNPARDDALRQLSVEWERECPGLSAKVAAETALAAPDDWRAVLGNPRTLEKAEATWKRLMRTSHPDAGGSAAEAARLNAAIARAREVIR